jgi:[protein-PII] uridylyltransferase
MTAQRRNIEDPATIAEFASLIKNQPNLEALMLLTLADGQGTGDENWSDWKEGLVWALFRSTSFYFADGEAFYRQRAIEREGLRDLVRKKMAAEFRDEIDAHFEHMPERYFQAYGVAEICEHIRLFRAFLEAQCDPAAEALAPVLKWIGHPNRGHSEFLFCGWDRNQLLSRIAGSLSVAQLNILGADVFTRSDNLVLDIFRVCSTKFEAVTDEKDMALVEKRLRQSLESEDFDFHPLLAKSLKKRGFQLSQELDFPTRLVIDNDAHPVYTLVDIQTPDRLGLLYRLLNAFAASGVQIALSRIATEKGAAIDAFYVTGSDGKKLRSAATIAELQRALHTAAQTAPPA